MREGAITGTADVGGRSDVRPRAWVVGPDLAGIVLPFFLLVVIAAVALAVGRSTADDGGGVRDTAVFWGFYGSLFGVWMMAPYVVGYGAGRAISIALGVRVAAILGYTALVVSLVVAIAGLRWGAIILGTAPAVGTLVSVIAYAVADRAARASHHTRHT
jgi:hypothetical protein